MQLGYSPRELVTDHLNVDLLAHLEPEVADEVLIDPRLKFTHPTWLSVNALVEDESTWYWSIPESGFAIAGLLGDSCGIASRALEGSSGRVGLTSHGSVRGSGGTGGSRSSISRWVLVLERIEVLERHF